MRTGWRPTARILGAIIPLLFPLFPLPHALAGVNVWTSSGPAQARVLAIAVLPDAPETVYAATIFESMSTAFKSTDFGLSWTRIAHAPAAHVTAIAIAPSRPKMLYAAAWDRKETPTSGVYRSDDAGRVWRQVKAFTGALITQLAVDPLDPQTLYAGGGVQRSPGEWQAAVWESRDGGESWAERSTGLAGQWVVGLLVSPGSAERLYAATDQEVFRSENSAQSWQTLGAGFRDLARVSALTVDPQNEDVVYAALSTLYSGRFSSGYVAKSLDGSRTWTVSPLERYVTTLAVDPSDSRTVYAGAVWPGGFFSPTGGLFRSQDGGAEWTPFTPGIGQPLFGDDIYELTIDSSGRFLHAATTRGVFDLEIDPDARAPILPAPRGGPREVPFRPD